MVKVAFSDDGLNFDVMQNSKVNEFMKNFDNDSDYDFFDFQNVESCSAVKDMSHLPLVVAIDASTSMDADAGDGKTKFHVCQELINSFTEFEAAKRLSKDERERIDLLTPSFSGNKTDVVSTWQPICIFDGIAPVNRA